MKKMKLKFATLALVLSFFFVSQSVSAHCEIPCGIYGDSLRVSLLKEHVSTIEKSMKMIGELSEQANPNYNQLVRWVMNKEEHATKIQDIVSQYFLHQRVKITNPSNKEHYNKYIKQLAALHEISVYSVKAKQSSDISNIENLRKSVEAFEKIYFNSHEHK